jgi:gas vesicle protein GvpK
MSGRDKVLVPPSGDRERPAGAAFGDALSRRINADPERVEKGLAQLVLTIVELLRQLMERQALHRVEEGGLTAEEVERLGRTLMLLEQRMEELKQEFGLEDADLNLNLGPLGNLM